ncbi:hypothetical protein [Desulfitibacter alkalitolerans]|uniref:hypothetical protein n=1 Tax=Desulfitibacter alkalitolerans TaxID=264641 RepID=UPI0004893F0F|nr:hypothetical protein [Desulfitibacter alkalitolerans]
MANERFKAKETMKDKVKVVELTYTTHLLDEDVQSRINYLEMALVNYEHQLKTTNELKNLAEEELKELRLFLKKSVLEK